MPVDDAPSASAYHLFVGVDIAATLTAVWMAPSAAPGRPLTLDQTPQGFATLQARLLAAGHAPSAILVVMEATGSYTPPTILPTLHGRGVDGSMYSRSRVHAFAAVMGRLHSASTPARL